MIASLGSLLWTSTGSIHGAMLRNLPEDLNALTQSLTLCGSADYRDCLAQVIRKYFAAVDFIMSQVLRVCDFVINVGGRHVGSCAPRN